MAENRGGYRPTAPQNNPANISALGGDGQSGKNATQAARYVPGLPYGEGQKTMEQQTSAPLAGDNQAPPTMNFPEMTPLMSPTARPEEPITTGIDIGAGAGSEIMQRPNQVPTLAQTLRTLMQYDPSGDTELIYRALTDQGY